VRRKARDADDGKPVAAVPQAATPTPQMPNGMSNQQA
jgi:hypothetical protein